MVVRLPAMIVLNVEKPLGGFFDLFFGAISNYNFSLKF